MNTCPDCKNDLVCHDQGECLRPTPETDAEELHEPYLVNELPFCVVRIDFARRLERERNEARELLDYEKSTRNAIIAKGIEMEHQLAEAREELEKWETELSAAMPPDFKDWFQNDKSEWPEVARRVIESLREREDFFMKTFEQNDTELRQAREENARLREAINLAETHLCYIANDDSAGWDSRDEAKQGLIQLHRALTP